MFSTAWSRRHPHWALSCAAFAGATSRQLDRVSRELLARAWQAGAGPGDAPLTIDLDSTVCETSPLTHVVTQRLARRAVRDHQLVASAQAGHGHNFATDWPRKGRDTMVTPASGAITHCWLSPPAPETC